MGNCHRISRSFNGKWGGILSCRRAKRGVPPPAHPVLAALGSFPLSESLTLLSSGGLHGGLYGRIRCE